MRLLHFSLLSLVVLALVCGPGTGSRATAGNATVIKIATLAPRNSSFMRSFMRLDQRLRQYTGGAVGFRLYPSGSAGDERDVLRKMRVNQMDAAMVTADGLSQILPEVSVMRAPGIVTNYQQLEAVQKTLLPEFEAAFEKKGFSLIAWGEGGEYRYFSKQPVRAPSDIRNMRPWLWPQSLVMQATWQAIGVTPVPLGLPEVYGAIQTRMVDLVQSTAVAYIALQWQTTDLRYVSAEPNGALVGALIMNKSIYDRLQPDHAKKLRELTAGNSQAQREQTRKADQSAYNALVKHGMKATALSAKGEAEMEEVEAAVCKRLAGRVFSPELLAKVRTAAASVGGTVAARQ